MRRTRIVADGAEEAHAQHEPVHEESDEEHGDAYHKGPVLLEDVLSRGEHAVVAAAASRGAARAKVCHVTEHFHSALRARCV